MNEYVFKVDGMMCSMCESHINDAIREINGVHSVKTSRKKNETSIVAECLDVDNVISTISKMGYEASFLRKNEFAKKTLISLIRGN